MRLYEAFRLATASQTEVGVLLVNKQTLKMRDMKTQERKFGFRLSCLLNGHYFRVELVLK